MALDLHRPGTVPSPEIDVGVPSPDNIKPMYKRQLSDAEFSSGMDTPRKNKRKLSEPKRRTTDFSIKRFCPDSPGSACSESGRSEESTPERAGEELRDSSPRSEASPGSPGDRDAAHPHLTPPFVFSDMRNHPYFIPQFYYNRFPGFPGSEQLSMFPGFPGLPSVPVQQQHTQQHTSHPASTEHSVTSSSSKKRTSSSAKISEPESHARENVTVVSESASSSSTPSTRRLIPPVQQQQVSPDEDNESSDEMNSKGDNSKKCRKNYKNMTRERRVEANARERSRVHTISAAFEGLRRAVPSYSYNQKLSKLAILRIACSYINALTQITDADEGRAPPAPSGVTDKSFAECVDNCTRTIQTEGKARRRH